MQIRSIENVLQDVTVAGQMAHEDQRTMRFDERSLKGDGSVLTETDQRVERYLSERIANAYPETNILGEEHVWSFDPDRPYTFVIDPIDGTDAFSQGMHVQRQSAYYEKELRPGQDVSTQTLQGYEEG